MVKSTAVPRAINEHFEIRSIAHARCTQMHPASRSAIVGVRLLELANGVVGLVLQVGEGRLVASMAVRVRVDEPLFSNSRPGKRGASPRSQSDSHCASVGRFWG